MADIKAIRYESIISLTHEEFSLIFKAVGKAVGAKVKLTHSDVDSLRQLNARLATIREEQAAQMHNGASAARQRAVELLTAALPEDLE
jgi:hypothetical protein